MNPAQATELLTSLSCYGAIGRLITAGELAKKANGGWSKATKHQHTKLLKGIHQAAAVLGYRHPRWMIWPRRDWENPLTLARLHDA